MNKKIEPDFEYFQEKQPGINDYETNRETLKHKETLQDNLKNPATDDVVVEEKNLPVPTTPESYIETYTELFLPYHPPKLPLTGRDSVVYEPIIDEKSGYADPDNIVHKETEPYQGIYLQPVDGGVPVYDKPEEPNRNSELDNDEDDDDNAYEVYGTD